MKDPTMAPLLELLTEALGLRAGSGLAVVLPAALERIEPVIDCRTCEHARPGGEHDVWCALASTKEIRRPVLANYVRAAGQIRALPHTGHAPAWCPIRGRVREALAAHRASTSARLEALMADVPLSPSEVAETLREEGLAPAAATERVMARALGAFLAQLRCHLGQYRYECGRERDLQDGIEQALQRAGYPYRREERLSPEDVVDFLVGTVALEVKISGSPPEILRQLARYAAHERVGGVLLVTRKAQHAHAFPLLLGGKPLAVLSLGGGL